MRLRDKKIILGICGSIAAYKAAILLRLLVKEGAEVQVVITDAGKEFITPVTLSALSGKPVISEFFGAKDGTWHSHVDLGLWADVMLVAPATACSLGKMANATADNMLITTYLSAKCPVFIAPAMDLDMFAHPANQKNIEILRSYGNHIIEPGEGDLASGLHGKGRMEEPEEIVDILSNHFHSKKKLKNKKFLITAGPTFERIDPVRYIGNFSSGKMGYAIADALYNEGAEVTIISGPVNVQPQNKGVKIISIESAQEMFDSATEVFTNCDGAVMTAAVADFTSAQKENKKIKREKDNLQITLTPTKDIAAALGAMKSTSQLLVGFALETNDAEQNARKKLKKKNLDFIVLNSLSKENSVFGSDKNKITIIDKNNKPQAFELKSKREVAKDIVQKICSCFYKDIFTI